MPLGEALAGVVVDGLGLEAVELGALLDSVLPGGLIEGAFGLKGSTVGGGTSGTPEGRLTGIHPMPPGPISIVIGLL